VVLLLAGLTVVVGFVGAGLAGITITVFLHRGLTHGAIRMSRPLYEVGRWMTWCTTFMRHWEWRLVHRKHHIYTDVWIDEVRHDPHSPIVIGQRLQTDGFRRVAWHMAAIFHAEVRCPDIRDGTYELESDRPLDRLDRIVFNRPVIGAIVTGVLYAAVFAIAVPILLGAHRTLGLEALCVVAGALALGIHIGLVLRFGGAINSDCHRGKEFTPGAGYAINVGVLSFLIFGEGEHLTHHLYPQLAQISRRWDLGWRVIQALRLLGLTDVIVERRRVLAS
jgi:stearoyl-CoA desaturase (delta-9 desaturase)